jgi:branched-chain amino acid transport system substrate-binding protein
MKREERIKWIGLIVSVLAICLMLSSPVKAARDEIVIGAVVSLTGGMAANGEEQLWAYKQAIADYNKKGGIYIKEAGKKLPIRLVVADDESEPAKAAQAMETLIKVNKLELILSTTHGPLNVAAANAAEKYKVFYMISPCWPFMWLPNNYQWSTLVFFTAPSAAELPFKIRKSLPESERYNRIALLVEDSPDGAGFGDGFEHFAKEYGLKFALHEPRAIGAKDYTSQILKMKAKKVDALYLFGSPADCITMVRQMKEFGVSVKYLHGWKGTWPSEFATALGKDSDYILCDGFWSADFPYPGAKELGQRYTKEFHKYSVSVGLIYANAQMMLMAIEKAQSVDKTAVRDIVRGGEFKGTPMGDIKFNDKGFAQTESIAVQWWKGKHRLVYPPHGGWKLKMAPPWDNR